MLALEGCMSIKIHIDMKAIKPCEHSNNKPQNDLKVEFFKYQQSHIAINKRCKKSEKKTYSTHAIYSQFDIISLLVFPRIEREMKRSRFFT